MKKNGTRKRLFAMHEQAPAPRSRSAAFFALLSFLLCALSILMSGCAHDPRDHTAPRPPPLSIAADPDNEPSAAQPVLRAPKPRAKPENFVRIAALGGIPADIAHETVGNALSTETKSGRKCRIKDRFDRDEVLAYEWGNSRLSFDVDGLSLTDFSDFEMEQIRMGYRLRLQTYTTKKERCRYPSHWQGLAGSSYNEIFVRESDTLWQELDLLRNDLKDYWAAFIH